MVLAVRVQDCLCEYESFEQLLRKLVLWLHVLDGCFGQLPYMVVLVLCGGVSQLFAQGSMQCVNGRSQVEIERPLLPRLSCCVIPRVWFRGGPYAVYGVAAALV